MNKKELEKELEILKVSKNYCSLDGTELPDRIIITKLLDKWLVYYFSERGERFSEEYFNSESEACQYIYNHMLERKKILDSFTKVK